MPFRALARLWEDSPMGMAVYEPVLMREQLIDMTLLWVNAAMMRLTGPEILHQIGHPISEISPDGWKFTQTRFAIAIATSGCFTYARRYESVVGPVDIRATAWYSAPYVGVLLRESSDEQADLSDYHDVTSAIRLLDERMRSTQQLAELLVELRGEEMRTHSSEELAREADSAGIEPATH